MLRHDDDKLLIYYPRMLSGNVFGCVCMSMCLSVCNVLILTALT